MKIIYLRDENYNWKEFKYEILKDLKNEFEGRNITLGDFCTLGNSCALGESCEQFSKLKNTNYGNIN
jgi:hypothetical protein